MITAVDTNILLDVLIPGAAHAGKSKSLLDEALAAGALMVCEIVYAELATRFPDRPSLDRFLDETAIRVEPPTRRALHRASEAWREHLAARRRHGLRCPRCGARHETVCARCGDRIPVRQHILADFLIGAHAAVHADRLLTRDLGFYRRYFPELRIVGP